MHLLLICEHRNELTTIERYLTEAALPFVNSVTTLKHAIAFVQQTRQLPTMIIIDSNTFDRTHVNQLLLAQFRATFEHVPLLVMTANATETYIDSDLIEYVTKPIQRDVLLHKVKQLMLAAQAKTKRIDHERELTATISHFSHDLQLAKMVQKSILPAALHAWPLTINAQYEPSQELSGDLYYWVEISDCEYGVILLDVSGHGIPSALVGMSIRSLLNGMMRRLKDPALVARELNAHIHKLFADQMPLTVSVTAIILYIHTSRRTIEYVNAGHPPGLLAFPGQPHLIQLAAGCLPLGLVPDLLVDKGHLHYESGARLLMFTDGLTEIPTMRTFDGYEHVVALFAEALATNEPLLPHLWRARQALGPIEDDVCLIDVQFS